MNPSSELNRVAEYFIAKARVSGKHISNKKLQKLVYYAQAWNLVINNEPLFKDPIEAWIHGPAIRTLYSKYKKYGYDTIKDDVALPVFSQEQQDVLDEVWDVYGKYDANYLEVLSHSEDPWLKARGEAENNERSQMIIEPELMKAFYGRLLTNVKEREKDAQEQA